MKWAISTCGKVIHNPEIVVPVGLSSAQSWGMNTLTRTLITTFPLLCAVGVAAAPAAAHPDIGAPSAARPTVGADHPRCAEGGPRGPVVLARPPERIGRPILPPQRAAVPGTVPVAPQLQNGPTSTGTRLEAEGLPSNTGAAGLCGRATAVVPVIVVPRRELVPAPVPVQVTVHDLGSTPARAQGAEPSAGPRSEIEIVVRAGGGSGSAAELPTVLREMLRVLAAQQRVPTPRPHR